MTTLVIESFASEFRRYRGMAEKAVSQLSWEQVRRTLDPETNSIAVIMKHVGGNLRSRWTEPLTTDGEKAWRDRDGEFVDDFADRAAMEAAWAAGWGPLDAALASFSDEDLGRELRIRGEPHSLAMALTRSLAHVAYHTGQVVQCARVFASVAGSPWQTLTVPRGGTGAFNRGLGYDAGPR